VAKSEARDGVSSVVETWCVVKCSVESEAGDVGKIGEDSVHRRLGGRRILRYRYAGDSHINLFPGQTPL